MIKHQAFLDLEESLASRLRNAWAQYWGKVSAEILSLAAQGRFDEAHKVADTIDLDPLFTRHKQHARTIGMSALLLGASRITPSIRKSQIANKPPLRELDSYLSQLGTMLSRNATQALRLMAHEWIAAEEHARMVKGDWSEADHPRGKTTEGSNDGSFTFKDVPGLELRSEVTGAYSGQVDHRVVASLDGQPVGHLDYAVYDNDATIQMVEVSEAFRRRGIAAQMLKPLYDYAREKGLRVRTSNMTDDGAKFFGKVGKLPDYRRADPRAQELLESNPPMTEGIEAAEEAWRGGVADLGSMEAAQLIQAMPGYFDYRSHLEEKARELFGDVVDMYRSLTQAELEAWQRGDDIGPRSFTFNPQLAHKWENLAQVSEPRRVVRVSVPVEAIVMRGKPEEDELVIDVNALSWHRVEVEKREWDETDHPRGKTTEASNDGSFTFASRESLVPELRREYRELATRMGQGSSPQDDDRFLALGARIREVERDWAERITAAVSAGVLTLERAEALGFNDPQGGTALKPLPVDLWHVTTAAPAIGASRLKTQHELGRDYTPGLGGGMDHVLSFTDSEAYANLIRDTLVLARQVARGEVTLAQLEAQAQQGVGGSRPFQQRLRDFIGGADYGLRGLTNVGVFDAHRYGITYTNGVPELPPGWEKIDNYNLLRPMTEEEKFDFTETYFKAWLAARGEAGGPENPLIAFNDWRKLAALPEDAIGVVRVTPNPNSVGWHYPWEHEYRTHPSAVRVAEIRKGEWREEDHPRGKTTEASNTGSFAPAGGTVSVQIRRWGMTWEDASKYPSLRIKVLVNPTREQLLRWAGGEVQAIRSLRDQMTGNLFVFDADASMHCDVIDGLAHAGLVQDEWLLSGDATDLRPPFTDDGLTRILAKLEWNEEDHPRGKTTDASNAGSFTFKERLVDPTGFVQPATPEFKRWFSESVVVDEKGDPLPVYHGTSADIEEFDFNRGKVVIDQMLGPHFAADVRIASQFATVDRLDWRTRDENFREGGNIVPVYLAMSNPWVIYQTEKEFTDPEGQKGIVHESDQYAIARDIAQVVFSEDKDLFVQWITRAQYSAGAWKEEPTSERSHKRASEIWELLKVGKPVPRSLLEEWNTVSEVDVTKEPEGQRQPFGTFAKRYTNGAFGVAWQEEDQALYRRIVTRYKDILKDKLYDGVVYRNTAPMEIEGQISSKEAPHFYDDATGALTYPKVTELYFNPLTFIPFDTRQVKSVFNERPTSRGGLSKLEKADDSNRHQVRINVAGKQYLALAASVQVSRLSAFGFLAEAAETGARSYRVDAVLDERTCEVCRQMDGWVFPVEAGLALAQQIMDTDDPDTLKAIAPFYAQNKRSLEELQLYGTEDFIAEGMSLPPYHPMCRCILTPTEEDAGTHPSDLSDRLALASQALYGAGEGTKLTRDLFGLENAPERPVEDLTADEKRVADWLTEQLTEPPAPAESPEDWATEVMNTLLSQPEPVQPDALVQPQPFEGSTIPSKWVTPFDPSRLAALASSRWPWLAGILGWLALREPKQESEFASIEAEEDEEEDEELP